MNIKLPKGLLFLLRLLALLALVAAFYVFGSGKDFTVKPAEAKTSQTTKATATVQEQPDTSSSDTAASDKTSDLPDVTTGDWELLLVNRDHIVTDLSPELTPVGPIFVDSRIAEATANFLAAAQAIDPNEHLISGYRSVLEQEQLYQGYIQQEMALGLTEEAAIQQVQTYSQPPGASEHHTGLAIDMSTVDTLNQSDPAVVEQIKALAPTFGFVLRFPEGKTAVTGIGYEDWHYRYVGVASAQYMTEHDLTLEEYIERLQEAGR